MRKKFILASLLTICSLAMIGCQGQQKSPQDSALADTAMINIYLLAGRMGMRVTTVENEKIIFSNDTDSVVIYRTIGKVYLNYEYLAETGKIKNIDGLPCIRASLGDEISAKLKKPKPKIVIPAAPISKITAEASTFNPVKKRQNCRIVLDPGHGGKDPGAISPYGFYEKTVNLNVALQLAQMLKDEGFDVILTRDSDGFIELETRANIANTNNADLFVSIHADSCPTSTTNGFTLYVAKDASWASRSLAAAVDNRMAKTGIKSKGIRTANFRVLVKTRCPAVLIELGYLSNYWEAKKLKNKDMQKRLAGAITAGIQDYKRH